MLDHVRTIASPLPVFVALAFGAVACSAAADAPDPWPDLGSAGATSASSSTSTAGGGGSGAFDPGGGSGGEGGMTFVQTPVRTLPGLEGITFYETTGATIAYPFDVSGPELAVRLPDPLGDKSGYDISGASSEYYDVYYSDEDGEPDIDGSYLTISGVFEMASPYGGGLNLAEIALDYGEEAEYGNYVASFVALGDNALPNDADRCIDGDLDTWTTMGNTVGQSGRLRLTLGFLSSSGPEPPLR